VFVVVDLGRALVEEAGERIDDGARCAAGAYEAMGPPRVEQIIDKVLADPIRDGASNPISLSAKSDGRPSAPDNSGHSPQLLPTAGKSQLSPNRFAATLPLKTA
jgi:hypothetical protein